ncbi:hypothetical protein RV05_GL000252 [Enterococcus hirae]|nr:hypothetical protein RV05_GL000252 [Enterococcus hirae]
MRLSKRKNIIVDSFVSIFIYYHLERPAKVTYFLSNNHLFKVKE